MGRGQTAWAGLQGEGGHGSKPCATRHGRQRWRPAARQDHPTLAQTCQTHPSRKGSTLGAQLSARTAAIRAHHTGICGERMARAPAGRGVGRSPGALCVQAHECVLCWTKQCTQHIGTCPTLTGKAGTWGCGAARPQGRKVHQRARCGRRCRSACPPPRCLLLQPWMLLTAALLRRRGAQWPWAHPALRQGGPACRHSGLWARGCGTWLARPGLTHVRRGTVKRARLEQHGWTWQDRLDSPRPRPQLGVCPSSRHTGETLAEAETVPDDMRRCAALLVIVGTAVRGRRARWGRT